MKDLTGQRISLAKYVEGRIATIRLDEQTGERVAHVVCKCGLTLHLSMRYVMRRIAIG